GTDLGRFLVEHGVEVSPTGAYTGYEWMFDGFPADRAIVGVYRTFSDENDDAYVGMQRSDEDDDDYVVMLRWELPW
ncbi:hypothetical protein FN846DRAFT_914778, partial [Sphaerosporella brunnea]